MSDQAGLYLNGEYLGKPKRLPSDVWDGLKRYAVVGRIVRGRTWYRWWKTDRWMTDRELAKLRRSFAKMRGVS